MAFQVHEIAFKSWCEAEKHCLLRRAIRKNLQLLPTLLHVLCRCGFYNHEKINWETNNMQISRYTGALLWTWTRIDLTPPQKNGRRLYFLLEMARVWCLPRNVSDMNHWKISIIMVFPIWDISGLFDLQVSCDKVKGDTIIKAKFNPHPFSRGNPIQGESLDQCY